MAGSDKLEKNMLLKAIILRPSLQERIPKCAMEERKLAFLRPCSYHLCTDVAFTSDAGPFSLKSICTDTVS